MPGSKAIGIWGQRRRSIQKEVAIPTAKLFCQPNSSVSPAPVGGREKSCLFPSYCTWLKKSPGKVRKRYDSSPPWQDSQVDGYSMCTCNHVSLVLPRGRTCPSCWPRILIRCRLLGCNSSIHFTGQCKWQVFRASQVLPLSHLIEI